MATFRKQPNGSYASECGRWRITPAGWHLHDLNFCDVFRCRTLKDAREHARDIEADDASWSYGEEPR